MIVVFGVWFGTLVISHFMGKSYEQRANEEAAEEHIRQEKIDALYGRKNLGDDILK